MEGDDIWSTFDREEEWLDGISRRLSGQFQPPDNTDQAVEPSPTPSSVRRSGRKRKSTSEASSASKTRMAPDKGGAPGRSQSTDDSVLAKLTEMIKDVRGDIANSETRTGGKIDELSTGLKTRLNKAELSIRCLSKDMTTVSADVARVQRELAATNSEIDKKIEAAIARASPTQTQGLRPRPPGGAPLSGANLVPIDNGSEPSGGTNKEDKYWLARRSLRLWPIEGPDRNLAVVDFIESKLEAPPGFVTADKLQVKPLLCRPGSVIKSSVLVTFESASVRDSVKALARNLRGLDRAVGVQMEPPDHLRSQYAALQSLAFQMKRKNPSLKRNIKFDDLSQCLVMDVLLEAGQEWKTVDIADAKAILKKTGVKSGKLSRRELEEMVVMKKKPANKPNDVQMLSDSDDSDSNTIVEISDAEDDDNKQPKLSSRKLTFINANARSLGPKIDSLVDCFYEKFVDFAFITETWYQSTTSNSDSLAEYADRFSLGVISRNRQTSAVNGRQYGGVAFFYRYGTSSFREFPLTNPAGHEVLATVGKVKGIKGKIFCITCYAPPNLSSARANELAEYGSEVISEAKRSFNDCLITVAGDFNQWPLDLILDEHPSLTEVMHGNTRGDRAIDRSLVNYGRSVSECGTLPPLETEAGNQSDHRIAWAQASFAHEPEKQIKYSYRQFTDKGADNITLKLGKQSWEKVFQVKSTSDKVSAMQEILDSHMSTCFEWKTTSRRESDPPWVNDKLKWLWKKRRKVYDREGRSTRWRRLNRKSRDLYRKRATTFVEQEQKRLTAKDASKFFHRNVKAYSSREKPPDFDPRDLYPGEPDQAIAEKIAVHFNSISSEFEGLTDIPDAVEGKLPTLSILEVANRIKKMKKTKSMVKGDLFPRMLNRLAPILAPVLTHIFNSISTTLEWPAIWKIEYVTPIPKKSIPQSVNDLRNISCTQFFSKLYESFLLDWIGEKVKLRTNQFGGVKGSSTEHFLVDLWQKILENLEDPRGASLLTSIDFAKAFNRLDFNHCLRCLANRGCSKDLVAVVGSFLSGRVMRVKVGDHFSDPKPVLGGIPQGSRLGVLLFNLAIAPTQTAVAGWAYTHLCLSKGG